MPWLIVLQKIKSNEIECKSQCSHLFYRSYKISTQNFFCTMYAFAIRYAPERFTKFA